MRLIDSRAGVTAPLEMWDSFISGEGAVVEMSI